MGVILTESGMGLGVILRNGTGWDLLFDSGPGLEWDGIFSLGAGGNGSENPLPFHALIQSQNTAKAS